MEKPFLFLFKLKFRIKEINPAYDSHFGKGKGWIFCTNEMTYSQAHIKKQEIEKEHRDRYLNSVIALESRLGFKYPIKDILYAFPDKISFKIKPIVQLALPQHIN